MSETVEAKPKKERTGKITTVTLDNDATVKTKTFLEQANAYLRGVTISKSQLVNWLINQRSTPLSDSDLKNLKTHFQSEKGRALWIYEETLRNEQAGISKTVEEILKEKYDGPNQTQTIVPRQKRKKKELTSLVTVDENNIAPKDNVSEPDLAPLNGEI